MKKRLSILAFLTLNFVMHSTCSAQEQTQTTSPKDDSQVQEKFAAQILESYSIGDFWYLEQLCNEKADSICDPLLAWGCGMAAARLFQLDEAKKLLGKFVYDYRDQMPPSWTLYAGDVLSSSLCGYRSTTRRQR